jgi:uncharacterized repeat protein (TIGR01451 family)
MSKTFLMISFGMLAAASLTLAATTTPGARKQLHGHVPPVLSHLTPADRVNATNQMHLAIGLPLRNTEALTNLLEQIYDSSSPNYRHYLTPEEFTAHFGPTEQDLQKVVAFAKAGGLAVTRAHGNRMLLEVTGKASDVEKAFNVKLHTYRHPTENRDFIAPDQEPSVPAELSVLDVGGLSSYNRPHPLLKKFQPFSGKAAAKPLNGSAPDGVSYMGYDYRKAYVPGTTLTGAGQKVALVQFDGYFPSDIAAYQQLTGLPAITITNILLDGFDGAPTMTGGEVEVELDIEMVNSWAPGLSELLVYEENPNVFNPVVVLNQIAMDNAAKQVSSSWGWGLAPSASGTVNQILQQMALQGQSFFQASGDSDAMLPGEADDPNGSFGNCCDAYLTSVGGTKLRTDGRGNYRSESVWNDRTPNYGQGGDWGSSGGISTFYPTPSWQVGFGTATNHGTATGRNYPDVALTAEDVYIIVDNGQGGASGGTSAAAPAWAGFTALVNQQAVLNGKSTVGFINPALYALAKTTAYNSVFNDVTIGDNTWPQSPTNFFAVPGYDLATGLGTPGGTNLINALAASSGNIPVIISAPLPPWGTNLAVMNGSNPNGAWFLFAQDDKPLDVGVINSGWFVTLTTANPVGYAADNQLYVTATNSVTATNLTLAPGANFSFTLAVTNYGPSSSTNVIVTENLPATGVTLLSSNLTVGSVNGYGGSSLTWNVGNLPINTGGTLTLHFLAASSGIYTNSANVNATTLDPNSDDDAVSTLITVGLPVPPQLTPSYAAGTGAFRLSVTNSPGQSVIIQASTNLVSWLPVFTNTEPFTFTNFDSTNFPFRFYRAVTGP